MRTLAIAALLAVASAPAIAAQGELCASEAKALTPATPVSELTNDTVFKCPTIGDVTIPQVYEKGWRIVQVSAGMAAAGAGPMPNMNFTAIIEKL